MLLLVLDQVVVRRGDIGFAGTLQSKGILAVGENAHDRYLGELSRAQFVNHGLEIGSVAGYKDCEADGVGHFGFGDLVCFLFLFSDGRMFEGVRIYLSLVDLLSPYLFH